MTVALNRLRLEQTSQQLQKFQALRGARAPQGGWLRTIRQVLGRTSRQQAARVGVGSASLLRSEQAEAEERISLGQLRKLAAALDCELVYAIVPRRPLQETVESRAEEKAREEILGVAHSMSLEEQRPSDEFLTQQLSRRRDELLSGKWSHLWR
jgi:predicted DNA-binding mobile mystery protein A